MTKLSPSLPEGDANGLAALAPDLVHDPRQPHLVIAVVNCKRVTTDADTGASVPTARIIQAEPILGQDKDLAVQMMRRALEERTGQAVLPLDLEDEINAAFDGIDPATGEILDGGDDQ